MADFILGRIKFHFVGDWVTGYSYIKDDVVRFGGNSFVCKINHTSAASFYTDLNFATPRWAKMTAGTEFKGNWAATTVYKLDDIVKWGAYTYICNTAHTSQANLYLDEAKWTIYNTGFDWKGNFADGVAYKLNDVVKYGPSLYICTDDHTSSGSVIDLTKFTLFVPGLEFEDTWTAGTSYQPGDIVSYGGYVYTAVLSNTGVVPYANTATWEVFTTGFKLEGIFNPATFYKVGSVVKFGGGVYVAIQNTTGNSPDPTFGGGTYWEQIQDGINWRDTWSIGLDYLPGDSVSYGSSSYRAKVSHTATNGSDRPDNDTSGLYWDLIAEGDSNFALTTRGDILTRNASVNTALPIGGSGTFLRSDGTDPVWSYNTGTTNVLWVAPHGTDDTATGRGLSEDRPYLTIRYAATRALALGGTGTIHVKTGQYNELCPIKVPADWCVMGEELRSTRISPNTSQDLGFGTGISADGSTPNNRSKMFLMNNGTGLRNCTLTGMTGVFNSADAYGTVTVNGGEYVAFDPAGAITSKSPYIQGVSTFGTRCVGMRLDGSVQASGYKTMVANDFTQILDEGIGIWASNSARAELVSVFTYYNKIGYLAQSGSVLRATNGNNSYGDYGSVSSGFDATETPYTATVNNRDNEAQVGRTLIANGAVSRLEFEYAGENYTTASYTFSGTGSGASVASTTFANNGIKYIDVVSGGANHRIASSFAQTGNTTEITLTASDTASTSSYNGMRINLVDGTGAGQTGIISTYNAGTKVATIVDEAGSPGWDTWTGASVVATLDTTTKYEIEPRVTINGGGPANTALARAVVEGGAIVRIFILDSGSGYTSTPSVVITDPNATVLGTGQVVLGSGVIRSVTLTSGGSGYEQLTADTTVAGDGFAEIKPLGSIVKIAGLSQEPRPGASFQFAGDSITNYFVVSVGSYVANSVGGGGGTAQLSVSPSIVKSTSPNHAVTVTFRERYSNIRLTGHDFLNIGTGGFASTNYPGIPAIAPDQTKEVEERNLGRVFYTSTDQDGNFRVGSLFRIEQATGIATLNAEAFDLTGLSEIALIPISGFSSTIEEFSSDGTLVANSNSKLPTQQAVKTYIDTQLGGGGNDLVVNSARAGLVRITGGTITTFDGGAAPLNLTIECQGAGVITFNDQTQIGIVPSANNDITNKSYVDDNATESLQTLTITANNEIQSAKITNYNSGAQNVVIENYDTSSLISKNTSMSVNANGRLIITLPL
jgi:hypothetical protein